MVKCGEVKVRRKVRILTWRRRRRASVLEGTLVFAAGSVLYIM